MSHNNGCPKGTSAELRSLMYELKSVKLLWCERRLRLGAPCQIVSIPGLRRHELIEMEPRRRPDLPKAAVIRLEQMPGPDFRGRHRILWPVARPQPLQFGCCQRSGPGERIQFVARQNLAESNQFIQASTLRRQFPDARLALVGGGHKSPTIRA